MSSLERPPNTGVVGQARSGSGHLIECRWGGELAWVRGLTDGVVTLTLNRAEAAWWKRPDPARAWAAAHRMEAYKGGYSVVPTKLAIAPAGRRRR